MSFESWFERSVGDWVSHRRYLHGKHREIDSVSVHFSIERVLTERVSECVFKLVWCSERNGGEMEFCLEGDVVWRSRGYYGNSEVKTRMERVDEDCVVFWSEYGGQSYREEIRYVEGGRLRQTVAYRDGVVIMVGQYWEERIEKNKEM